MEPLLQAEPEVGMCGPLSRGVQLQQRALLPALQRGESTSSCLSVSHFSGEQNLHVQNPMEQPRQARTEAGLWGPWYGGEELQQIISLGTGDPSSSTQPRVYASPCLPVSYFNGERNLHVQDPIEQHPQAGIESGNWVPWYGGDQLHGIVPVGVMRDPSLVQPRVDASPHLPVSHFSGKQNLHVPNLMEQVPEAGMWVPWYEGEQLQQQIVPVGAGYPSSSVQPRVGASPHLPVSHFSGEQNFHVHNPIQQPRQAGTEAGKLDPMQGGEHQPQSQFMEDTEWLDSETMEFLSSCLIYPPSE